MDTNYINISEPGYRWDILDVLRNTLGDEKTLRALVAQMSDDEAKEAFIYIARHHEIEYKVVQDV